MSELYLIAHKVRGEPAFDIAIQLDTEGTSTDPAPWWIIPTSGHRARPYWHYKLEDLYSGPDKGTLTAREMIGTDDCPPNWPDHYAANNRSLSSALKGTAALLEDIGL